MKFDKTAYMRTYMAAKRAGKPASRAKRMQDALETIAAGDLPALDMAQLAQAVLAE